MRIRLAMGAAAAAGILAACGDSPTGPSGAVSDPAGTWTGKQTQQMDHGGVTMTGDMLDTATLSADGSFGLRSGMRMAMGGQTLTEPVFAGDGTWVRSGDTLTFAFAHCSAAGQTTDCPGPAQATLEPGGKLKVSIPGGDGLPAQTVELEKQ